MELLTRIQAVPGSCWRRVRAPLTFAGSAVGIVSRRAVRQAVIPQEQVTAVLALQAHAAAVPQVGHALPAQGVAV